MHEITTCVIFPIRDFLFSKNRQKNLNIKNTPMDFENLENIINTWGVYQNIYGLQPGLVLGFFRRGLNLSIRELK